MKVSELVKTLLELNQDAEVETWAGWNEENFSEYYDTPQIFQIPTQWNEDDEPTEYLIRIY